MERARRGDRDAFAVLAVHATDRLYRVAYRILRDVEDARDATQDALFEAWRDLPGLRDVERWEAWTYRLLVHACYRHARRERVAAAVRILRVEPATGRDSVSELADRDAIERGFRRLPPEQRAVVVLHHYVGLPLTEVAQLLGIPDGTARSRLHHATRRLRAALDHDAEVISRVNSA